MEAVPRLPMLSFDLKVPADRPPTEFSKLKQYIRDFYHEDPESYSYEIMNLESLRASAVHPVQDINGCAVLKKYYCQLHFLQSRFPMSKDGPISTSFSWKDMHSHSVVTVMDIKYEIVSILYNIGTLHIKMGAADDRTTPEGLKMACTHFQCAAWAFQHSKDTYPQPHGTDLSPDIMQFMYQVSLAQAQECILEKSMTDNRKATINAKVAWQIVDYYNLAMSALIQGSGEEGSVLDIVGGKLYKVWKRYIRFKSTYYACVSLLYQGLQSEEQQKMGERVAYYQAALDKLNEAVKLAKGIDQFEAVQESLVFTRDVVEGKRKAAKSENDFIYHEEVPEADSLPQVKGASLVKGIAVNVNDPEISGQDIFARLVPIKAHEASSLYSEEKAKLLRKISSQIDGKDEEMVSFMSCLQLDHLQAHLEPDSLPQEVIDRCAALNAKPDAIPNLIAAMDKLNDAYHDVDGMLQEIMLLIKEEEKNEKEYQEMMGPRAPSIVATELTREANKYNEAHKKAKDSNETLNRAMAQHIENLRVLQQPLQPLLTTLPTLTPLNLGENDTLKEVIMLVGKVEEMRKQRATLASQLRESICSDDITSLLVTNTSDNLDNIFDDELKKHEHYIKLIEQNLAAQENIKRALTDAYAHYAPTRKATAEIIRQRELILSALISSYDAYEDLLAKSSKGLEFYRKLETNLTKLLQRVKGTCKVQDEERQAMLARNNLLPESVEASGGGPKLKDYLAKRKEAGGGFGSGYSLPEVRPAPVGSETQPLSQLAKPELTSQGSYPYYPYGSAAGMPYAGLTDGSLGEAPTAPFRPESRSSECSEKSLGTDGVDPTAPAKPETPQPQVSAAYYNQYTSTSAAGYYMPYSKVNVPGASYTGPYGANTVTSPYAAQYYTSQVYNGNVSSVGTDKSKTVEAVPVSQDTNAVYNVGAYTPPRSIHIPTTTYTVPGQPPTSRYAVSAQVSPSTSHPPAQAGSQFDSYSSYQNYASSAQNLAYAKGQYNYPPNQYPQAVSNNTKSGFQVQTNSNANQTAQVPQNPYSVQQTYPASAHYTQPVNSQFPVNQPQNSNQPNLKQHQPVTSQYSQPSPANQNSYSQSLQSSSVQSLSESSSVSLNQIPEQATNALYPQQQSVSQNQYPQQQSNPAQYPQPAANQNQYSQPAPGQPQYIQQPSASSTQFSQQPPNDPRYPQPQQPAANQAQYQPQQAVNQSQFNQQLKTGQLQFPQTGNANQAQNPQQSAPSQLQYSQQPIANHSAYSQQLAASKSQYSQPSANQSQVPQLAGNQTQYSQQPAANQIPYPQQSNTNSAQYQQPAGSQSQYSLQPSASQPQYPAQAHSTPVQYQQPGANQSQFTHPLPSNSYPQQLGSGQPQQLGSGQPQQLGSGQPQLKPSASQQNSQAVPQNQYPQQAIPNQYPQQSQLQYSQQYKVPPQQYGYQANAQYQQYAQYQNYQYQTGQYSQLQGQYQVANGTQAQKPPYQGNQTYPAGAYQYPTQSKPTVDPSQVEKSSQESNVDLLAGLDFTLPEPSIKPICDPPSLSSLSLDSQTAPEPTPERAVTPALKEVKSTVVETKGPDEVCTKPARDPFSDPDSLNSFVQEVEKYEKFVDGLCMKTLSGPTPLDIKWNELQELQDKEAHKQNISVARCYPMKNRYPDILPYDNSRVELPSTKDDYINASFAKGLCSGCPNFIMTQSPLASTMADFWTMILEQHVELIVCLLSDQQMNGEIYWPQNKGEDLSMGQVKVTLQSCNVKNFFVERIISVSNTKTSRVVVHLQFTAWPNIGWLEESPAPWLALTSEALAVWRGSRAPQSCVVVHCDAGVGRSGLFVLTAMAFAELATSPHLPDVVHLATTVATARKNPLRDRDHLKFAYQIVLYYCQDLLMKRGILSSKVSFEEKRSKTKSHTRHPSQDFLLNSSHNALSEERRLSDGSSSGRSTEYQPQADPLTQLDPLWSLKKQS